MRVHPAALGADVEGTRDEESACMPNIIGIGLDATDIDRIADTIDRYGERFLKRIFTDPEIATAGITVDEAKAKGIDVVVGKFPFAALGKAMAMGDTDGFVKILADKTTDRVLGAHIIGPDAGTLIAEMVTAMEFGASAEDVARTCHANPSLNEAVKEAALAVGPSLTSFVRLFCI